MKKVMPFAQMMKEKATAGTVVDVLSQTPDVDEKWVLETNLNYLLSTLEVTSSISDIILYYIKQIYAKI